MVSVMLTAESAPLTTLLMPTVSVPPSPPTSPVLSPRTPLIPPSTPPLPLLPSSPMPQLLPQLPHHFSLPQLKSLPHHRVSLTLQASTTPHQPVSWLPPLPHLSPPGPHQSMLQLPVLPSHGDTPLSGKKLHLLDQD